MPNSDELGDTQLPLPPPLPCGGEYKFAQDISSNLIHQSNILLQKYMFSESAFCVCLSCRGNIV